LDNRSITECCSAKNKEHTWVLLEEIGAGEPCRMFIFYRAWCSSCGSLGTKMCDKVYIDEEPTIVKFWKYKKQNNK